MINFKPNISKFFLDDLIDVFDFISYEMLKPSGLHISFDQAKYKLYGVELRRIGGVVYISNV